ncbi:hypothetical protein RVR_498 [Actinacidiphila reveromycinica]|uniref:ABC-2 type transporter transmembrane domain-containing protein n=1 Tax=Actinacidiphila reveromycinica TaxID=659352 RepID=A0A7U3VLI5_9ACTN|nr:ABC transporter permease [Streptomyces sp. SN-593]BBA95584.1 hypothetical protein RVR_498 [Streptomyces sp. SN-593]
MTATPAAPAASVARRRDGAAELATVLATSARVQLAMQRAHPMSIMLGIVQPAVLLVIGSSSTHGAALDGFALASGLSSLWGGSIWTAGGILRREIEYGTLPRLVCSPWNIRFLLLAKSLAASMFQTLCITVTTVGVLACSGHTIAVRAPGALLLGILVAVLSAAALGLLLSSLFVLTRAAVRISEALSYPVLLLGGMLIPSAYLPAWLRWPSAVVSLSWIRRVLHGALTGSTDLPALAAALALTAGYAAAGWLVFDAVLDRARLRGTLELR